MNKEKFCDGVCDSMLDILNKERKEMKTKQVIQPDLKNPDKKCPFKFTNMRTSYMILAFFILILISTMLVTVIVYFTFSNRSIPSLMALQVGGWGKVPSKTVKELYRPEACSVQQRVPDLPVPLRAHVAIEVKDLGLLVCGGTSEAHNSVPGRDCFIFSHKDGEWKQFHKLNIGRINAYVKLTGDKIIIIGGSSTDPFNTCLQTE